MTTTADIQTAAWQGHMAVCSGTGPAAGRNAWTGRFIGALADPCDLVTAVDTLRRIAETGRFDDVPVAAAEVLREAAQALADERDSGGEQ
jgi:hypothetical protein